jgi:hypothetical protein
MNYGSSDCDSPWTIRDFNSFISNWQDFLKTFKVKPKYLSFYGGSKESSLDFCS